MWLTKILIPSQSNNPDSLKNPSTKPKVTPKSQNIKINEQKQDPHSKLIQETPVTPTYPPDPISSKETPKVKRTKNEQPQAPKEPHPLKKPPPNSISQQQINPHNTDKNIPKPCIKNDQHLDQDRINNE